ncbi:MAG: MMPL family transporter, partial [Myxococcota bacterium]
MERAFPNSDGALMKPSNTILVLYRFRWPLALLALAVTFFLMNTGMGQVEAFSDRVTSLRSVPPEVSPPPRMFDPRTDIWFDPEDSGLKTFYEVEDKFIAEDIVVIAFEETEDPWGVFGTKALTTIAELSSAIEKVPGVRNVRSLTTNPWIRFGEAGPGEEGLIVGDLFERDPNSYSEDERLERMIAIVGAENAANRIGEERVKALLGSSADFSNYIGEPRLLDAVVNAEASTTALMISILRPRPSPDELDSAFADAPPRERDVGPAIHVMETQAETVGAIERILAEHPEYAFHSAGIPLFEREFFRVGQSDMAYVGLMFVAIGLILGLIFRRVGAVAVPLLIVFMSIMAMVGTIFTLGDLLNNLTAAAPVMVTAVGIADAVHLITSYYLLRPQYDDKHALISAVLAKNALPVFLTSLTTSIGFFSLMTGEIIPIQMLGYAAGVGTISAYLLSMTVIPAMLSLLPLSKSQAPKSQAPKNKERSSAENTGSGAGEELKPAEATRGDEQNASPLWADRLVALVLRHRVPFISGAVLTIALSIFGMSRIEMSSDMRMMFPADNRIISDVHWIEARLGGASD